MARPRTIDQQDVLAAAEAVVGRNGAAHLTLDAVAAEAGISKASVIYDYGSKQSLIQAIIGRRLRLEEERIRTAVAGLQGAPGAEMRGRLAAAEEITASCGSGEAAALNLCSAMAQDESLRVCMQEFYRRQIDQIVADAELPDAAIIAFLALEGLKTLECFGFHSWPADERKKILKNISLLLQKELPQSEVDA